MAEVIIGRKFKKEKRERSASASEDNNYRKLMRDEKESSISKLEELVKCSIHLDKLNDPRMLPCAHVFCLECLADTVTNLPPNVPLKCPICLRILPITSSTPNKVMDLPKACFHNELEEYLNGHDQKKRLSLDSPNKQDKINLHKLLLDHPDCSFNTPVKSNFKDAIRKFSDVQSYSQTKVRPMSEVIQDLACDDDSKGEVEQNLSSCIDLNDHSGHTNSSYCLSCSKTDQYSIIKSNMRKYSRYRLSQQYGRNRRLPGTPLKLLQEQASSLVCVVNSNNGTVEIRKPDEIFAVINPTIKNGCPLRPIYARYYDNHIYVSGVTLMNQGFMVKINMQNTIVACSSSFKSHSSLSEKFPIGGFCFDPNNEKIYFAVPAEKRICILSIDDLHEFKLTHVFTEYRPVFLAHRSSSNEVWVSCPKEHRLLVMNIEDGSYQQLPIDRVNSTSPLQIVCTWESGRAYQRVIFLDNNASRLYWMVKQGSHVDIQAITFTNRILRRSKIRHLDSFDIDNRLVIINEDNEVCIIKPEKDILISSPSKRDEANCVLL